MSEFSEDNIESDALIPLAVIMAMGSGIVGGSELFEHFEAPVLTSSWHDTPQVKEQVEVGIGFAELPTPAKYQFMEYGGVAVGNLAVVGVLTGILVYRVGRFMHRLMHRNDTGIRRGENGFPAAVNPN